MLLVFKEVWGVHLCFTPLLIMSSVPSFHSFWNQMNKKFYFNSYLQLSGRAYFLLLNLDLQNKCYEDIFMLDDIRFPL
jgi:hypothetical protein